MGGLIDYGGILDLLDETIAIDDTQAWLYALGHEDVRKEILRLNFENQLFEEGIDSLGQPVTNKLTGSSNYSPFTIDIKRKTGLPYDRITLFQDGTFYRSKRLTYDSESYTIDANGDKSDKNLFDVYGDDVLGLTDFNKERIEIVILRYYDEWFEKRLLS
jgi:hypothetical protein